MVLWEKTQKKKKKVNIYSSNILKPRKDDEK